MRRHAARRVLRGGGETRETKRRASRRAATGPGSGARTRGREHSANSKFALPSSCEPRSRRDTRIRLSRGIELIGRRQRRRRRRYCYKYITRYIVIRVPAPNPLSADLAGRRVERRKQTGTDGQTGGRRLGERFDNKITLHASDFQRLFNVSSEVLMRRFE